MSFVERKCVYCGKTYMGAPNGKYCSRKCKYTAEMRKLASERGELECPQCGKKFFPITNKQRFCCKSCESIWSHANSWKEKERTCATCGAAFKSQRKDMYECPECRKKRTNLMTMESRKRKNPCVRIGIGSGGDQHWLEDNKPVANWDEIRNSILENRENICAICGHPIRRQPCVHHISMDRSDNNDDNLAILCIRCHQNIHKLITFLFQLMEPSKDIAKDAFEMIQAELKHRKNSGTPCEGQSDLKAVRDDSQGQRLPVEEDLLSTDKRPMHPTEDEKIV